MSKPRKPRPTLRFFRLTITFGSDIYAVIPQVPAPTGTRKAFRLKKMTGDHKVYQVRLFHKHPGCNCRGFLRWGHCKHVAMLRAALMLD